MEKASKSKVMKEELTTEMHYEFLKDNGVQKKDLSILAVYGAIQRGVSKSEALKRYNISEKDYDKNIDKVLNSDESRHIEQSDGERIPYKEMETVFEHSITKREMKDILGFDNWGREEFSDLSQDSHYAMIYRLYLYRGKEMIAKKYAAKIPNTIEKVFGLCNHDFAVDRSESE